MATNTKKKPPANKGMAPYKRKWPKAQPKKGTKLNDPYPSSQKKEFIAGNMRRKPTTKPPVGKGMRPFTRAWYKRTEDAGTVLHDPYPNATSRKKGFIPNNVEDKRRDNYVPPKPKSVPVPKAFPKPKPPQKKWQPVYKRSSAVAKPKRKR